LKQLIDQRGLAVVNMGDNGDVAKFFNHCLITLGGYRAGSEAAL
jgi:hypothetical protein